MTADTTLHLGLDLGGTNVKWAVVAASGGTWRMLDHGQVPTDAAGGPASVVPQLVALARDGVAREPAIATVGLGIPGLYLPDAGEILFFPNVPGDWRNVPVARPIADATRLPVALINDARAFGLAELRLGAGRGAETIVGYTLGTGIGGVVCVGGRVHQGFRGTAGELGHMTIDPDGPLCGCGNRGCVEAYARADRLAAACGAPTAEEALRRAAAGDPQAAAGVAEVGRYLGIGLANAIVALTPDRIVLGGGIAASGTLLIDHIRAEIRRRVRITDAERIGIVLAELGTWAGAIGAAVHGAEAAAAGRSIRPGAAA